MSFRRDRNDRQNNQYDRERSPDRSYNRQPSSSTYRWDDDRNPYDDRWDRHHYVSSNDRQRETYQARNYDRNRSNSSYDNRQDQHYTNRNSVNHPFRVSDDFKIIERLNDLELDTKFLSPNGDILIGDFQRRHKVIKRDKWKQYPSEMETVSFEAYNAYITTYCHLIEMQEVKDVDSLVDAIKWLTGIDFTQQDNQDSMHLDRQSSSSEEEGQMNVPSSILSDGSVLGVSLCEITKGWELLYLASSKRVLAVKLRFLNRRQEVGQIFQRLFASKLIHLQAWRAAEICIKLAKYSRLNFRLRDLTFGQGNEGENLYDKALKCDGIDSNVVSPFFVKRMLQPNKNVELVSAFHNEPATEAYRCALINGQGENANTFFNSGLLRDNIDMLYEYVLTLDAQNGEDTESACTIYQIEFDERKSGQDDDTDLSYDMADRIDSVPHFDIFCYRDPMISPSQVVHFELKYMYSGKTIYADAYGQCYAKHGKRAYICFPKNLKPRTQGNFTIPSEAPGSSRLMYNEPFKKDNSLMIERITVIGKPVFSAQQKHDYEWLVNACTEKEDFQLHFKDRSGLVPFIYPDIGNLAFRRNKTKELKDKKHLYHRLGVFSDFIHFEAPQKADLNDQQFAALTQIFDLNNIVVAVEGFAGTGKSKVIEQAIIHCKREIMRITAETWHRIYCDRLPFQQNLDLGNHEEIPSVLIESNEIKPMILVLTRTNASKLHISAKDQNRNSSLILESNRFSSYDKSRSTCNSSDFATTEKVIRTLKDKIVMYATIGAFHNIAKTFLQVANIQCIIVEESNSVYPLELASLLSTFFLVPKLVLCGDLKQLSPYATGNLEEMRIRVPSALENVLELKQSPYSEEVSQMLQGFIKHLTLDRSYRLPKNMLSLLRNIRYDNLLYDKEGDFVPSERMNCRKEILFFQYNESKNFCGEKSVLGSTSWINPAEADTAIKLLLEIKRLAPQLIERTKILAFYSAQRNLIVKELKKSTLSAMLRHHQIQDLVSTLDAFQGKEDDIIILCPTRRFNNKNPNGNKPNHFVSRGDRVTVAFTRAKKFTVYLTHGKQMDNFKNMMSKIFFAGGKQGGQNMNNAFVNTISEIANHI